MSAQRKHSAEEIAARLMELSTKARKRRVTHLNLTYVPLQLVNSERLPCDYLAH
jgi:hypothetical protein